MMISGPFPQKYKFSVLIAQFLKTEGLRLLPTGRKPFLKSLNAQISDIQDSTSSFSPDGFTLRLFYTISMQIKPVLQRKQWSQQKIQQTASQFAYLSLLQQKLNQQQQIKMSRDNFLAINLTKIELFFQQLTQNNIRQSTIAHFNTTFGLALDNLPLPSMYETAQAIETKAIKHNKYQARQGVTIETSRWSLGQKPLYFCVFAYFAQLRKLDVNTINQQALQPIQEIFVSKSLKILYFEIKEILCGSSSLKKEWTNEDTELLVEIMKSVPVAHQEAQGEKNLKWRNIAYEFYLRSESGGFHSVNECRQKWINHLNPNIAKRQWAISEDVLLFSLLLDYGCKWSLVSKKMSNGRTEHMVKNRFNSIVKRVFKKVLKRVERKHLLKVLEILSNTSQVKSQEPVEQLTFCSGNNDSLSEAGPELQELVKFSSEKSIDLDMMLTTSQEVRLVFVTGEEHQSWAYDQAVELFSFPVGLGEHPEFYNDW